MTKKGKRVKRMMGIFAACAIILLCLFFGYREKLFCETSTEFRYPMRFQKTLGKYDMFHRLLDEEKSFAIPGLCVTNVTPDVEVTKNGEIIRYADIEKQMSEHMVPQGICFADDYVVLSAYDSEGKHNSILYVLSKENREYLTTIVLEDKNHVGGVAYDGKHLWIAKSGDNALSCISYERIHAAVNLKEDSVGVVYDATYAISCRASFVDYYDGMLWVGVFEKEGQGVSVLRGFSLEEHEGTTGLFPKDELFLPELANGAAILDVAGATYLMVDSSHGRNQDSKVRIYKLNMNGDDYENAICQFCTEYVFPPMLEEVSVDGDVAYFVFESAATKYSGDWFYRCKYPVDRVCAMPLEKLLSWIDEKPQIEQVLATAEKELDPRLQYHITASAEAKQIPTYYLTLKNKVQMLYNPDTAKLLSNVTRDMVDVQAGIQIGDAGWHDTMAKNGYGSLQSFRHDNLVLNDTMMSTVDVVAGIVRKSSYNGKEKFNILIGIEGQDQDVLIEYEKQQNYAYQNDVVAGFYDNAWALYERLQSLTFDVPVIVSEENGMQSVQYQKMLLADMMNLMKSEDSRFTLTVTGAGIGGGLADILVGKILMQQGLYEGNVNCYTFDACATVKYNDYNGINIFNIVKQETSRRYLQGKTVYGRTVLPAADGYMTNSTYGILSATEGMKLNRNCFGDYQTIRSDLSVIVESDACAVISERLQSKSLKVQGELVVHGDLVADAVSIENGLVYVDGVCAIAKDVKNPVEALTIFGEHARLEVSGTMDTSYYCYTAKTGQHVFYYPDKKDE